ncbi:MAG: CxxxxCH/CxxCH domain-containing protein [Deltaproteobacteria bacterium]|nr:MAG: CxxxxCH/CxxCH domain-containing protein [Deltaproteobacteria bacterium]
MRALTGALLVVLAASACSKARPLQGDLTQPVSWEEDIAPLFAAQCSSCHAGATPAAGYRTTSYLEALGPQSAPVAVAGDANSLLLRTIDPARADAVHAPVSGAYDKARAWVVDGRLSFFRSEAHEGGILNPHDSEFHSNLVRERGWNFATCQSCHGTDLAGGKVGVSCQQCHAFQVSADGTTTCSSCHGSPQSPAPPRDLAGNLSSSARGVGAHQAHLLGRTVISATIACSACHQVPAAVDSPGHIESRPAEVIFSGLALASGANPTWNGASCSSTYCHGGGTNLATDTAFRLRTPVWTAGTSQAFCGSCHGSPPSTSAHAGVAFPDCARCHANTVSANGTILVSGPPDARTSAHINGAIDVTP